MRSIVRLAATLVFVSVGISAQEEFPEGRFRAAPVQGMRQVIGANDFEKMRDIQHSDRVWNLGRRVAQLRLADKASCSGWLVGPDLLLTNHHCTELHSSGIKLQPSDITIYMEYYEDGDRGPVGAHGKEFLRLDQGLDFALLRLDTRLGDRYGWFELDPDGARTARNVRIIQHPRGRSKEVCRHHTEVVAYEPEGESVLHYLADTEPGSSGSPVLDINGDRVIALHHVGTDNYNEAVLIGPILEEIQPWLPGGGGAAPATSGTDRTPPAWRKLIESIADAQPLPLAADRERYQIGEDMQLRLELPREGYLNVVALDEQGEATVLYPNRHARDNYRHGGKLSLPASDMPFAFTASPPAGRQLVVGILTAEPLNLFDDGDKSAADLFAALGARGVGELQRSVRAADAHAAYVVTIIGR